VETLNKHTVNQTAEILIALGIALFLEGFLTIEWTYPYCLSQSDGPAYAALGMPLPYLMRDGARSSAYYFMPHAYIFNVVLLSGLVFLGVRCVRNRATLPNVKWVRPTAGLIGSLSVVAHVAYLSLAVSTDSYQPAPILQLQGYFRYAELRPAAVIVTYNEPENSPCTPSRFWYPTGWRPKTLGYLR
jgi:hypothetical protein